MELPEDSVRVDGQSLHKGQNNNSLEKRKSRNIFTILYILYKFTIGRIN